MSLTLLTAADRKHFDTLPLTAQTEIRRRLDAIFTISQAPRGTKNQVTTPLADELGVTIGTLASFCVNFRKSGLTAIIPREKPTPPTQPSLTR